VEKPHKASAPAAPAPKTVEPVVPPKKVADSVKKNNHSEPAKSSAHAAPTPPLSGVVRPAWAQVPKLRTQGRKRRMVVVDWDKITDEELLKLQICELPIAMEGTNVEKRIQRVYRELEEKGIRFHPECYLGDEWFSPEGDPVISIPFYLAHPRLIRLEQNMVLEAEGDSRSWFLSLLRHEMGHALTHAYDLEKYRGYATCFGSSAKHYPDKFRPRPYSRQYVQHLEDWYAQIHPDEDFAETFAVWLDPETDWRTEYKGWGALRKLQFVDAMMQDIGPKPPMKSRGAKMCRLSTLRIPLKRYYQRKRKEYAEDYPDYFDTDLKRIFTSDPEAKGETSVQFLRRHRKLLRETISQWSKERRYTLGTLIDRFVERGRELNLRVHRSEQETLVRVTACLASMASNYFLTGKFKRPL